MTAQGLIDTTEMYLRTVFELEEEGIVPLRARIAERLAQSGPTVSQTVARMERDGLVHVADDRQLSLSDRPDAGDQGHAQAPAGRVPAGERHRAALGGSPHRGMPVGARDLREASSGACWNCSVTRSIARMATSSPASTSSACRPPRLTRQNRHGASAGGADAERRFAGSPVPVVIQRISEQIQSDIGSDA